MGLPYNVPSTHRLGIIKKECQMGLRARSSGLIQWTCFPDTERHLYLWPSIGCCVSTHRLARAESKLPVWGRGTLLQPMLRSYSYLITVQRRRVFFMDLATNRYKVLRVFFKDLATNRYKVLNLYTILFIIFLFLKEVHENISHSFLRSFAI